MKNSLTVRALAFLVTCCWVAGVALPIPGDAAGPLGYVTVKGELPTGWHMRRLPIYDKPGGDRIGGVNLVRSWRDWCFWYPSVRGRRVQDSRTDKINIDGCHQYLYYERQGNYVRIFDHSSADDIWLGLDYAMPENPEMQLKLATRGIVEGIAAYRMRQIRKYDGYRLYAGPDSSTPTLFTLDEKKYVIMGFTGRHENGWLEAVVFELERYPRDRCPDYSDFDALLVEEKTGWLKVLTSQGQVDRMRFENRGCQ